MTRRFVDAVDDSLPDGAGGEIRAGLGSDGEAAGGFDIAVSSDFLMGRDPAQVYDSCVYQQSGQLPSQPLYSRSDWRN